MSNSKRSSSVPKNDDDAAQSTGSAPSNQENGNNISKSPPNFKRRSSRNEQSDEFTGAASSKRENILPKSPAKTSNEKLGSNGAGIETAHTSPEKTSVQNVDSADGAQTSEGDLSPNPAERVDHYSTKQRRLEYFRSGTDADCEVHVPKNGEQQGANVCYKKFRCHRIFLATASEKLEQDVFQNKQWNGILQINGVSPESVEIFLEYIYTFEITSSLVNLGITGDIYILSNAYNMPELLHTFSKRLKNIDWELPDIFPSFNFAFQHNMLDLENDCLKKILNRAGELTTQPSIMKLQIYAFNYLIQHWMATEALTTNQLIQLLQQYQQENDINFKNTKQFPHFTKIVKYFPDVLFDAEGIIYIP